MVFGLRLRECFPCHMVLGLVKKIIIFGVDNSTFAYGDNRNKDTLILGKGPRDGLDGTSITAEA